MRTQIKRLVALTAVTSGLFILAGCTTESDVASQNLSEDADNFKVQRKITLINTVTDEILYTVEGNMSVYADTSDNQLEVTARIGENEYKKDILGLSPTTVYIVEQVEWQETNKYRYKVTIKPSTLIPDVDIK